MQNWWHSFDAFISETYAQNMWQKTWQHFKIKIENFHTKFLFYMQISCHSNKKFATITKIRQCCRSTRWSCWCHAKGYRIITPLRRGWINTLHKLWAPSTPSPSWTPLISGKLISTVDFGGKFEFCIYRWLSLGF